jgi:hypothetical protein
VEEWGSKNGAPRLKYLTNAANVSGIESDRTEYRRRLFAERRSPTSRNPNTGLRFDASPSKAQPSYVDLPYRQLKQPKISEMNNSISAYDSSLFRNIFTSDRMREIFSKPSRSDMA